MTNGVSENFISTKWMILSARWMTRSICAPFCKSSCLGINNLFLFLFLHVWNLPFWQKEILQWQYNGRPCWKEHCIAHWIHRPNHLLDGKPKNRHFPWLSSSFSFIQLVTLPQATNTMSSRSCTQLAQKYSNSSTNSLPNSRPNQLKKVRFGRKNNDFGGTYLSWYNCNFSKLV